jgi:hypothetical protein
MKDTPKQPTDTPEAARLLAKRPRTLTVAARLLPDVLDCLESHGLRPDSIRIRANGSRQIKITWPKRSLVRVSKGTTKPSLDQLPRTDLCL